jgi:PhnB protein
MADVNPIPEGYPRVSPYLSVKGAAAAIDFYTEVLGAEERVRMPGPNDTVGHAELHFGDSVIMLSDENPEFGNASPETIGGSPVVLSIYVEDVDAVYEKALQKGATVISKVEDQFYGDRSGQFEDPFGHKWNVSSHIEDVTPEQMEERMKGMFGA